MEGNQRKLVDFIIGRDVEKLRQVKYQIEKNVAATLRDFNDYMLDVEAGLLESSVTFDDYLEFLAIDATKVVEDSNWTYCITCREPTTGKSCVSCGNDTILWTTYD